MLIPVYDKNGQMFEVRPELAKNLVINHGWEMTKPGVAVAAPPVSPPVVEHDAAHVEIPAAKDDTVQTGVATPAPTTAVGPTPL